MVTNPVSVLRVTTFTRTPSTNNYVVTFPSVIGRIYRLESSTDLIAWAVLGSVPPAAGTGSPLTFGVTTPSPRAYFRVRVTRP